MGYHMLVDAKLREFCHQIHLGLSPTAAGRSVGVKNPVRVSKRPDIIAYILILQRDAAEKYNVTRDDVIAGFKDAIDTAHLLGDAQAKISGWREIGRMMGYYEPETKRIILSTEEENRKRQLGLMDEKLLMDMAGDDLIIDAEFDLLQSTE